MLSTDCTVAIGESFVVGRAAARKDVGKTDGLVTIGRDVAVVVPAQPHRQRQVRLDLPVVLDEGAEGVHDVPVAARGRLAGERIVGDAALLPGIVGHELQQVVEIEGRPAP